MKMLTVIACLFLANSVFARSIAVDTKSNDNYSFVKLPTVVSIVGVVAIVASGGFCLFHLKKHRRPSSEEHLTKANQNTTQTSTTVSTSNSTNSELHELTESVEERDICIKIDNNKTEPQNKRKSIINTILNRDFKKDHRNSNVQFMEDRSLNSISTNEDWINEQKALNNQDDLFDDGEEANSNDGFWNSDLEPVVSSSENKQESYAIPSLSKRNSVIVKGSTEQNDRKNKRRSIIIVDEQNTESNNSEIKPPRVKSWRNNSDLEKQLQDILKDIDEEAKLNEIKEGEVKK